MSTAPRLLFAALTLVMLARAHAHADDQPLGREDLVSIQEATRDLAREVEYLQDFIVETSGPKERDLYRQADAVLAIIVSFQESLKPKASREGLNKAFDELDRKVHVFLKAVSALGPEHRLLQRAATRVGAADDHLHYVLSAPGDSEVRAKQVLERETRTLVTAAQHLNKTARYTLGAVPGQAVLVGDLRKLAESAERFQKGLASGADRPQLRKDFAALNKAWEQAIRGMRDLQASENSHLLRAAGQLDRVHGLLSRLLGMEGERPQLIIRT